MTGHAQFILALGAFMVVAALIAAVTIKDSGVRFGWKLAIPAALVALGCWTPFTVNQMMGLPIDAAMRDLPQTAELISFIPHDKEKRVDLWLLSGDVPRAYSAPLDEPMKKALQEAGKRSAAHQRVYLKKDGGKPDKGGGDQHLNFDAPHYVIDESAVSHLPPKDGEG